MFSGFGSSFFGGASFAPFNTKFDDYFRCYPIAMMPDNIRKDDANYGGKIFLPSSALNKLTMLHIRYPMLFELNNEESNTKTHSGVLEFIAEEGRVYIPHWMMSSLKITPGDLLRVSTCDLPLGSFVKIEPQSVDFLDISDPRAVLENVFRKFSTLTINDIIEINYNDIIYGIKILEAKPESPSKAICVIETDLETDFAPPVGYKEPEYKPRLTNPFQLIDPSSVNRSAGAGAMAASLNYADLVAKSNSKPSSFGGAGLSLSGKPTQREDNKKSFSIDELDPNAPPVPLGLPENQLFFGFPVTLPQSEEIKEDTERQKDSFAGPGMSLRLGKKRKDKSNNGHSSLKNYSRSPDYIEID